MNAPFLKTLKENYLDLTRTPLEILQINVGKLCNQVCLHCHVEAGPKRTEIMDERTATRLIELIRNAPTVHTIDLTGGAPELNPHFKAIVVEARKQGKKIIDRCNLTVFYEPGQENLPQFLAENKVQVVASLPCYSKENVEKQRGRGVFNKSIEALKTLNQLGYGKVGTGLELNLVYNPVGAYLPPDQIKLENDYKRELREHFGIEFNRLFTITNMPVKRFLDDLRRSKKLDEYMALLINHFNPAAALGVMCRNLVSVSWDGKLYDCDFNQMLELPLSGSKRTLWDIKTLADLTDPIVFGDHCYGCTAGSGSSCQGSVA